MARRILPVLGAIAALALPSAAAAKALPQDVTLTMSDGVPIACTYAAPAQAGPGKAPALILFHGLGGKRQDMAGFADVFGAAGYASLACDARGEGASGGLFGLDGPRDVQDTRELFDWLAGRPEVDGSRIGAFGISLGGGAVLNAAAAGVPFKAIVPAITWSDLESALAPQGLAKSGLVQLLSQLVPRSSFDPALLAALPGLLGGDDLAPAETLAAARSSRLTLAKVTTPTFLIQGRHDFLFDADQALAAYRLLAGPKRLYLGDFGHAPDQTTGAPDLGYLTAEAQRWFDRFLKGQPNGIDKAPPVELGHDPWNGVATSYRGVPPTRRVTVSLPGSSAIAQGGRVVRSVRLPGTQETFGDSVVSFPAASRSSWDHVVAVLSSGGTVISEGGTTTRGLSSKPRTVRIRLLDEAVRIPRGARLTLTLGATSSAQDPSNLLYLKEVAPGSTLGVGRVTLSLSVLRRPVSR